MSDYYVSLCKWFKCPYDCDCQERIDCPDAGQNGHTMCGKCEHGRPNMMGCEECEGRRYNGQL